MRTVPLEDVADVIRGVTFSKEEGSSSETEGLSPVIRAGSIQQSLHLDRDLIWIPKDKIKLAQLIRKNDIIMCTSSGSSDLVGKSAISVTDWNGSFGAFCAGIRADSAKCSPSYLYHFLNSPAFRNWSKGASGANIKNIRISELGRFEIPLPPLAEQKRIAAILDKADALRCKRQQAIDLADQFLRSVFLDMFGDIPAKRSKYKFGTCRGLVKAQSGKSSKSVLSDERTQIPVYGGNGVNGYACEALFHESVIVVGRVGQQCAITTLTEGPSWVTDNAIVIQVQEHGVIDPVYLAHAFQHSPIRDAVTRLDLPFINQSMLLDYELPIPPIDEQVRFRKIRKSLLEEKVILIEAKQESDNLFKSLSQQAFSGQL